MTKSKFEPRFDFRITHDNSGGSSRIQNLLDEMERSLHSNAQQGRTVEEFLAQLNHQHLTEIEETGTINELRDELKAQHPRPNGELSNLDAPLNFISRLTGVKYESNTEPLPMPLLKTVKLLYLTNDRGNINLYQYLRGHLTEAKSTMEWRITGLAPTNKKRVQLVGELLRQLSGDIDAWKLLQIDAALPSEAYLLDRIEQGNAKIFEPFKRVYGDHSLAVLVQNQLTKIIHNYRVAHDKPAVPVNELVYTHIRALPFLNFVGEYKRILGNNKLVDSVDPILPKIKVFCDELSASQSPSITPDTPITSINGFPDFFKTHYDDLKQLVEAAIGRCVREEEPGVMLKVQKRDFSDEKLDYACKVLHSYVFHERGAETLESLDAQLLSATDCVAALCAVRYQQEFKTKYDHSGVGDKNEKKATSVFYQMGKDKPIADLYDTGYTPQGLSQLMYDRFCQFHSRFSSRQARHDAIQAFKLIRLDKYSECLALNDINLINSELRAFETYCIEQARVLASLLR